MQNNINTHTSARRSASGSRTRIDMMFPIVVFLVFALSILTVLLLSANIYEDTVKTSEKVFDARTCYSYVLEKIRQSDGADDIKIETLGDTDAIAIRHEDDQSQYTTYIYLHDHKLMELQMFDTMEFSPGAGTEIAELEDFAIKKTSRGLYRVDFTSTDGEKYSLSFGERSGR